MNHRSIALVAILVASGPGSAVLRATIAGGRRNSGSGTEDERRLCCEPSSRLFRLLPSGLHTMASRGAHRSAAVGEDVDRLHQERRPDGIRSYSRYESADGPELRYSVASYRLQVKTRSAKGVVTDEEFQQSDVWFKRNGMWKVVHLHYPRAPKKK
jgi:hypothetical protein